MRDSVVRMIQLDGSKIFKGLEFHVGVFCDREFCNAVEQSEEICRIEIFIANMVMMQILFTSRY